MSCPCVVFFIVGISATGPVAAADAPPASDRDRPAAPNTGTAFVPAFRFEACFTRGITEFLHAIATIQHRLGLAALRQSAFQTPTARAQCSMTANAAKRFWFRGGPARASLAASCESPYRFIAAAQQAAAGRQPSPQMTSSPFPSPTLFSRAKFSRANPQENLWDEGE
jgi:hypothetical protein